MILVSFVFLDDSRWAALLRLEKTGDELIALHSFLGSAGSCCLPFFFKWVKITKRGGNKKDLN